MPWFFVATPEYEYEETIAEFGCGPTYMIQDSVEVEAADEESARFLGVIALHGEESGWLRECEGRIHAEDLEVKWMGPECVCEHAQGTHEPKEGEDELMAPTGPCVPVGGCDCVGFEEAPSLAVMAA